MTTLASVRRAPFVVSIEQLVMEDCKGDHNEAVQILLAVIAVIWADRANGAPLPNLNTLVEVGMETYLEALAEEARKQ